MLGVSLGRVKRRRRAVGVLVGGMVALNHDIEQSETWSLGDLAKPKPKRSLDFPSTKLLFG